MSAQSINNLRPENWNRLLAYQRVEGLQALENQLAASENRTAAEVVAFSDSNARGLYDPEKNQIGINMNLVNDELEVEPYQATETLFHESRHAFQHHAIQTHPEDMDPETVKNWEMNNAPGVYTQPETDQELYAMQPVELDARQAAREKTDELFQQQFGNCPNYETYAEQKGQENQEWIESSKGLWQTENPEQVAVEKVTEKYSQSMAMDQSANQSTPVEQGLGEIQFPTAEQETGTSETENTQSEPSQSPPSEGQGEDYTYGYGY